jgi:hypothetical protein
MGEAQTAEAQAGLSPVASYPSFQLLHLLQPQEVRPAPLRNRRVRRPFPAPVWLPKSRGPNFWGEKAGRGRGRGRGYRVRDGVGWMRGGLASDPCCTSSA